MPERIINLCFGLASLALGAWVWLFSAGFPQLREGYPGPALFPRVIAIGLLLCGAYLTVQALVRPPEVDTDEDEPTPGVSRNGLGRTLVVLGLIAAYPALRNWLGFVPVVALIIFMVSISLQAKWFYAVLSSALVSVAIYYVFNSLLRVPL